MSKDPETRSDNAENIEKKLDPGASRYGNFMNYYQFHSAEERVRQLPRDVWQSARADRKYMGLDVGCNAGVRVDRRRKRWIDKRDLTYKLYDFLDDNVKAKDDKPEIFLLGIDLDPILIERSHETNPRPDSITFEHAQFLAPECDTKISEYLAKYERSRFDVVFCFSVTMWIHLNHGDDGLIEFFRKACSICDTIVVEPQPWKCYRNASRRLRLANLGDFPLIKRLECRGDMAEQIERILSGPCNFQKVTVTSSNDWQRKVLIYERKNDLS